MNGFTKKKIKTLTLGEKLKKLRSDRRISLNEVFRATGIQIKYLEYLENGDYDKLPADVYTKGFLRSYADFLGVDRNIFLKTYQKEKGIKQNLKKNKKKSSEKMKPVNISSFIITPKKILIFLSVILVLTGLLFLYKEMNAFVNTPRLIVLSPKNDSQTKNNFIDVSGVTDKDVFIFINGQPILVDDNGKFKENLILQPGVNVINVRAINKFKKEIVKSIKVRYEQPEKKSVVNNSSSVTDATNEKTTEEKIEGVKVVVKINPGPVKINVEVDGKVVFNGTMLTEASQTFQGTKKIVINSDKGNATYINFNGKDIGALSKKAGAVRGVTFTPDIQYNLNK